MEYKELAEIWKSSDNSLEKNSTLNKKLLKEVIVKKIKSTLFEFKFENIVEIIVSILFLNFMFNFSKEFFGEIKYLLPASFLALIGLAGLILSIHKLILIYGIDSRDTVVQTQKRVEKLKYMNLLETNMLYVIIPLFSAAFMIVMAKGLIGYDLYMQHTYLVIHIAGSFIIGAAIIFFLKKYPGKELMETEKFLSELKEAETEN